MTTKMFRTAETAEIMRSHQKDDYYILYLRSLVADIVYRIAGPFRWIQWKKEIDVLSDVGYFLLTTFGGYQTIGEEYVNIVMVDSTKRAVPSRLQRGLMILLQVCMPYFLKVLLDKLEQNLQSANMGPLSVSGRQRDKLVYCISILRQAVMIIHRAHTSLFFIQGIFFHIAKRFASIHYIRFMTKQHNSSLSQPFRMLGYLSLTHVAVSMILQLISVYQKVLPKESKWETYSDLSSDENTSALPSQKCSLCLGPRRQTTLTACGHLYCWDCIHQWCQTKPECPLCREQFPQHRLIPLQNFDQPDRQ